MLRYIKIVKRENILQYQEEAERIIGKIDEDDVMFIATALALNCPIWSDDTHFKLQKEVKVYNTEEMINLMSKGN